MEPSSVEEKATHKAPDKAHGEILRATLMIAGITFGARLLGLVKNQVIAARFGSGPEIEAFFLALIVPTFIAGVLTNYFPGALVPVYASIRQRMGSEASADLVAGLLGGSLMLLVLACSVAAVGWTPLLPWLARGFEPEAVARSQQLFLYLVPAILIRGIAGFCAALLHAEKRFVIAAAAPGLVSLNVAVAAWLLAPSWGATALAAGYLLGCALETTVLAVAWQRAGGRLVPAWPRRDERMRRVLGQYVPAVAGGSLMGATVLVDQTMAASLEPGSVAALTYADVVVAGLLTVSATALGRAILPYLSELAARGEVGAIRVHVRNYTLLILAVSVPATALLFLASRPMVALLYERGAFQADDTVTVAGVLALYFLKIPTFTLGILFMRALSALEANHLFLRVAALSLAINVLLNYVFMQWIGVRGIALSTAVVYLVSAVVLGAALVRRLRAAG